MIRLAVRCHADVAEIALAELIELAPHGIEEVRDGDIVEYAIYGPPGELPSLPDLDAAAGAAMVEVRTTEVADDWTERWKQFHKSVMIGGRLHLRPPWEEPTVPTDDGKEIVDVVIDPGQAFGTGSHPTTRLCVELLLDLDPEGEVVDLGCGSGLLAIVAAKLGFDSPRCYDFDQLAVTATIENAAANGVEVSAELGDLREALPPLAPTVLANLLRPLLLEVAAHLAASDERPSRLILSGLLTHECDEIVAAYAPIGYTEADRRESGDWAALLLKQ